MKRQIFAWGELGSNEYTIYIEIYYYTILMNHGHLVL